MKVKTFSSLKYGWDSRRAWWFTATARTRERFARTALGSFWLGFSNLLSIAALATVYGTVFKVQDFSAYVVYLGTGLVIWNAIAGSVLAAPTLLKANAGNIKNTNINPIFYTLEEWAFQVQTFLQSFGLVVLALSLYQPSLLLHLVTAGILPILNLIIFIYWLPLVLCLLGARYEDFFQLVPVIMQLLFVLSPILYAKEALGKFSWTASFNPLYRVLSSVRESLIQGDWRPGQTLLITAANLAGVYLSVSMLEHKRKDLPFLV